MEKQIILSQIPLDQLLAEFKNMVEEAVNKIQPKPIEEKLISISIVCKLFDPPISKPTLNNWVKDGKLKSYRIGNRIFYKHSEVMESMTLRKFGRFR